MPAGGGMTSARTLREPLEHFYRQFDYTARVEFDAIRFPLHHPDPRHPEPPGFLAADRREVFPRGRLSRGYRHLFPLPSVGGPCKRLHLFLRWMVRREPPDFGLWTAVAPSRLLIPVDTHVENIARSIGLTRRKSRTWRMAEEITRRLAAIDPEDPVKYDFALCHKRMSGDCRDRRDAVVCAPCGFKPICRHWK